eukprot:1135352-Prymnesium_polylepis.1
MPAHRVRDALGSVDARKPPLEKPAANIARGASLALFEASATTSSTKLTSSSFDCIAGPQQVGAFHELATPFGTTSANPSASAASAYLSISCLIEQP